MKQSLTPCNDIQKHSKESRKKSSTAKRELVRKKLKENKVK
jgi:hypothetical protein